MTEIKGHLSNGTEDKTPCGHFMLLRIFQKSQLCLAVYIFH